MTLKQHFQLKHKAQNPTQPEITVLYWKNDTIEETERKKDRPIAEGFVPWNINLIEIMNSVC